jgi:hypothetical protein
VNAPRLPGFGSVPRRRGRNERAVDALAAYIRRLDTYDPFTAAVVTLARTMAASLDRLEVDADRSEHVIGTVGRVQLQALEALRPTGPVSGDAFDELVAAMGAAMGDTAAP